MMVLSDAVLLDSNFIQDDVGTFRLDDVRKSITFLALR